MSSNGRIAETIFNLRKIGINASNGDGAVILENEESDHINDKTSKRRKCSCKSILLLFICFLVVLNCIGSAIFFSISSQSSIKYGERITNIENILNETQNAQQSKKELSNIRSDVRFLEHGLNSVRDDQTKFSKNVTTELSQMKNTFLSVMQDLLLNSNISLCSDEQRHLLAPVEGTYKMTATVLTSGELKGGETVASVTTSFNNNLSGGSIKVTADQADQDNRITCKNNSKKTCAKITHVMILKLSQFDDVSVVPGTQGAGIDYVQLCLKFSNIQLPAGVLSTIETH